MNNKLKEDSLLDTKKTRREFIRSLFYFLLNTSIVSFIINDYFTKKLFINFSNNLLIDPMYSIDQNKPGINYSYNEQNNVTSDEINTSVNYILEQLYNYHKENKDIKYSICVPYKKYSFLSETEDYHLQEIESYIIPCKNISKGQSLIGYGVLLGELFYEEKNIQNKQYILIISKERGVNNYTLNQEDPKIYIDNHIFETTWYFLSHLTKDYEENVNKIKEIIINHKIQKKENPEYNSIIDPELLDNELQKCTKVTCTDQRGLIFNKIIRESIIGISSFSILMIFVSAFYTTILSLVIFSFIAAIVSFLCSLFIYLNRESHTRKLPPELVNSMHFFVNAREILVNKINEKIKNKNEEKEIENKYSLCDIKKKYNKYFEIKLYDIKKIYRIPISTKKLFNIK